MIGAALVSKDFFALSMDERRWLTGGSFVLSGNNGARKWKRQGAPTKPYFLLFQQAVLDAVKSTANKDFRGRSLGTGEVVHFIFDHQNEYEKGATAVFRAMKQLPISVTDRIGDVVFSEKTRAVPLQIADFLAYESFSYLNRREIDGEDRMTNQEARLFATVWSRQRRAVFIDKEILQKMLLVCPLLPNQGFIPPPYLR